MSRRTAYMALCCDQKIKKGLDTGGAVAEDTFWELLAQIMCVCISRYLARRGWTRLDSLRGTPSIMVARSSMLGRCLDRTARAR